MPRPNPQPGSPYVDPFQWAKVIPERVDMGVDYLGRPGDPIVAIGPGVITESDLSWSGAAGVSPGTFIAERITAGPAKGETFYYAEDIVSHVHVGQHVRAGERIANFVGGGQSEFGWAAPSGGGLTMAAKYHQIPASGDPGANPTAFGESASEFLHSTGAPAGLVYGKTPVGSLPANWYPTGNIPINAKTTSILTSLLGGALAGSGWKDLAERAGLILLGAALIIVGVIVLVGKQSIRIATTAIAPEATLAEQVKANAVAMRAKGATGVNS